MHYYVRAQSTFKPSQIPGTVLPLPPSDKLDPAKPISAGFYRLEKGEPLVYTYTYHEMKIIVEGEYQISDEWGLSVTAKPGDVFFFDITPDYGLAFYCGQRAKDSA
ncbi:hypothetical protein BDD12DRAFT_919363 [Trichophaea hybrida]|nr:hypothetical protein BDD12DRAFT_919363 [Trichophaea hybrida]